MKTEYMTFDVVPALKKRRRRRAWRLYARLSLLALAAMMTARLVLLAVDVAQFQVDTAGIVSIPTCAAILFWTGWKARGWTLPVEKGGEDRE